MKKYGIPHFTLLLLVSACSSSNTLNQFKVYTSPSYEGPDISTPLTLVLSDDLKNEYHLIERTTQKEFFVKEFRKSLGKNMKKTLEKPFSSVSMQDKIPEKGSALVIDYVHISPKTITVTFAFTSYTVLTKMDVGFSLYRDGEKIDHRQLVRYSNYAAKTPSLYLDTVRFGVQNICEDITEFLASEDVQRRYFASSN